MNFDKTVVKESSSQQRPWEDRNAALRAEDSSRDRRLAEELAALNQSLEEFKTPS